MRLPKAIRDKFAKAGRKGGKAKGKPKGLAAMPAKKRREIQAKGARAMWLKGRMAREAKKVAKELEKQKGKEQSTT